MGLPRRIKTRARKGRKAHTWLSLKQVRKLLATCELDMMGLRDRVALSLMVGAGLRRQEVCDLCWEHVKAQPIGDEKMRTILTVLGKGQKWRTVPISDALAALLDEWAEMLGTREGFIIQSLGMEQIASGALSPQQMHNIVIKHAKLARLKLSAHDLRRTYAEIGRNAGIDVVQLQTLLGHDDLNTTRGYLQTDIDLAVTVSDFVPI